MPLSRRTFIGSLAAAGLLGSLPFLQRSKNARPNIVVFLADDLRADSLGYAGNPFVQTPHLDALAKESLNFTNCFVPSPVCPCSRASIFTGQHVLRHKVFGYSDSLSTELMEGIYPLLLKKSGYNTGFIGKWGIGKEASPSNRLDYWDGFYEHHYYYREENDPLHLTDEQNESIQYFLTNLKSEPFLLMVHFKAPHTPFTPQDRFRKVYKHTSIPRALTDTKAAFDALPPPLKDTLFAKRGQLLHRDKKYQNFLRGYYALVTGMDEAIGSTIKQLKAAGLYDDTCILFSSDNGMLLGEHGLVGKHVMFEETIRVPLLLKIPETPPASYDQLVLNMDLAPTILDLTNTNPAYPMHGKSLLKLSPDWRDDFLLINPEEAVFPPSIGVRSTEWKYVRYLPNETDAHEVLFHIAEDPLEERNLAKDPRHKETLLRLRERTKTLKSELA